MIKGIMLFEQGGAQPIGELNSLQGIINTIKQLLPELEAQEANRILDNISDEDLQKIAAARENKATVAKTGKTEKLK
jgi:hypothetical protein